MRPLALPIFAGVFVAALSAQQKFDPRDLSGHWDRTSPIVSFSNVPGSGRGATLEAPFTPEGKKMNDANKPGYGPRRGKIGRASCRERGGASGGAVAGDSRAD